jgi:hypothetical protein
VFNEFAITGSKSRRLRWQQRFSGPLCARAMVRCGGAEFADVEKKSGRRGPPASSPTGKYNYSGLMSPRGYQVPDGFIPIA